MSIDYAKLEHRPLQLKLLAKKYLPEWVTDMTRHQLPHHDATVAVEMAEGITVEFKHEYHKSNNLCLELISNIHKAHAHRPLGRPWTWNQKEDYEALDDFRAKAELRRVLSSGPAFGLMLAKLPPNHITQYIRAWPTADERGLLRATLFYFDTFMLQEYVGANRKALWPHTYDDKNDNHACLSVLVPVDADGLKDVMCCPPEDITMLYRPYDLYVRAKRAEEARRDNEREKQLKARTMAAIE